MTISLSAHQTRMLRVKAQRLEPAQAASLTAPDLVLRDVFAVQAQDFPAALLSIRARSAGLTAVQVVQALQKDHTIAWTWCMRSTMHLINAQDARWLIPFLGPVFIAANGRRFRQLGWDEMQASTGLRLLKKALAEQGEMTRPEIASLLHENGLPHQGQATIHLISRAALEGILCMGANRQGKPTYVLYEDWIGGLQPLAPQDALAELASRYLGAYGPACPEDMASWTGLKLTKAREAWQLIEKRLVEVEAAGRPAWMLKEHFAWLDDLPEDNVSSPTGCATIVRLLSSFDTYLLGYTNRDLVVDGVYARHIHPGGGLIYPVMLVDGRALGTWKARRSGDHQVIVISPFEKLADELLPLIEAEVADLERFQDNKADLVLEAPLKA